MLLRFLMKYYNADPAGGGAAGGGGGEPPAGGGQSAPDPTPGPSPAPAPAPAPVDPNAISEAARLEQAKALGFNSIEEMKAFVTQSRQKPPTKGDPDSKELQQKLEIAQKNAQEANTRANNTLKENAFHNAFAELGVQLHDLGDFKSLALNSLDVVDGDQIVVKNGTGDIVLNQKGERLSVKDHLQGIIDTKPWMVKNQVKKGPGVNPGNSNRDMGTEPTLETLKGTQVSLADFEKVMDKK